MPDAIASILVCPNGHRYALESAKRWRRTCPTCAAPLPCRVGDCPDAILARGLCTMHYARDRDHGDPTVTLQIRGDEQARFTSYCEPDPDTGCWVWTGGLDEKGYGVFHSNGGKQHRAHKWAWEQRNGPVPDGKILDHFKCNRPPCANPEHVRPATQRENVLRGAGLAAWNLAKTHCPDGHPYDEENTYTDPSGRRACRICRRAALRVVARGRGRAVNYKGNPRRILWPQRRSVSRPRRKRGRLSPQRSMATLATVITG